MFFKKVGFTRRYYVPLVISGALSIVPIIVLELIAAWSRPDPMLAWQAIGNLPLMAIAWLSFLGISAYGVAIKVSFDSK
ncbi:hypothetical protein [Botrimarina mediterranea]|uniref:hypothetical protein n=1 Tax=Botrimarina mediterranea TaxID=2528022 RepID=UPI0011A1E4D5|nr:hypothetical protein [Botrimarina mediterranea]